MDNVTLFWQSVNKTPGCWLWAGTVNADGYGLAHNVRGIVLAHRIVWTLVHGPIPAGMCVLHSCDVPACVNPGHLFLGTRADNCRDRAAKGRTVASHCYGLANGKARLSDDEVAEIRRLYVPGRGVCKLAARFGISHSTLINIAVGRRRIAPA